MTVGVVSGNSAFQPNHFSYAKTVGEKPLQLFAANSRISLLYMAQQTLFGGEQSSAAVYVDAAAFQHDATAIAVDFKFGLPGWDA